MDTPYRFVGHFIDTFGPRRAGSDAETKAQHYLAEQLRGFCTAVSVEPFDAALRAKFRSLRWFTVGFALALILPYWSLPAALIVAALNAVLYVFHFVLFHAVLDPLFPKLRSHNVIGDIEPEGPAESTLIFSGHMDSTPEFIWWYWFKGWGARMMVFAGFSWLLLPLFYAVALAVGFTVWMSIPWLVFVALSPLSLAFFFIHGKRIVPGAQDNLSGVAVAFEVARRLANGDRLERTRIRVVSFGAEECGLKGSGAYARRYREQLKAENTHVVNLDGIMEIDHMFVIQRELMAMQTHHAPLVDKLLESFERAGLPPKRGTIPIGGTDASSFSARGIPAASIVGMPMGKLHPTYHTRLDTLDCLDPVTMDRMSTVLVDFARTWDRSSVTRH
jgi:acetylornithine deacetylase/succinyl-diaminopimelate desuccinylase-like protein